MLVEMHNFSIEEQQRRTAESHDGSFDSFRNDDWDYERELKELMQRKSSKEVSNDLTTNMNQKSSKKEWNEL